MKYVLDSNVALKWVLAEPEATKLRHEFRANIHELIAPEVFEVEIAHSLTRAERQGRIATPQASILWSDIMSSPPRLEHNDLLLPRAITISSGARLGVYDCLFVALAEREACELVTADDKLLRNLGPSCPFIISLASLP